jgi:hypothetical protein
VRWLTGSWRVSVMVAESSVTVSVWTPRSKPARSGTKHSMTNTRPGASTRAVLRKQSTCRAWLGRLNKEFHTRYTRRNGPRTGTPAMSAMTAGIDSPPGTARSRSTTAWEASTPSTVIPGGQRQRRPATSDGQFQHPCATACEGGEKLHSRRWVGPPGQVSETAAQRSPKNAGSSKPVTPATKPDHQNLAPPISRPTGTTRTGWALAC